MKVSLTHHDPRPLQIYLRAYMAKRRSDCVGDPVRGDDGTVSYPLKLASLPGWATAIIKRTLAYNETVSMVGNAARVDAYCPDADVRVSMNIRAADGGTRVDCEVNLKPVFKGIPIPQTPLRALVRNRFRHERRRDANFIDAVLREPAQPEYTAVPATT